MIEPAYLYRAHVIRWIDGDTVDVDLDLGCHVWLRGERLRLVGPGGRYFDTPELKGETRIDGLAARAGAEALAPPGAVVTVATHKDQKGKYGRWLAQIVTPRCECVASALVAGGVGRWQP